MRNCSVRDLTLAAVVAALYVVMGYFGSVFGLTFGPVQFRFAEALTVLPFLYPATAPGLAVGCLIVNLASPVGPLDIVFGTLATAAAAWLTIKAPRWYLAPLPPILTNLLVLPPIWAWTSVGAIDGAFWAAWAWNCLTFAVGQAGVCYVLGALLLRALPALPGLKPAAHPAARS